MNADQSRTAELLADLDSPSLCFRRPDSIHSVVRLTYSDKENRLQTVDTYVLVKHFTAYVVGRRDSSMSAEGFAKFISKLFLSHHHSIESIFLDNIEDLRLVKYEVLDKADKGLVVELVDGKFVTTSPEIASSKVGIR